MLWFVSALLVNFFRFLAWPWREAQRRLAAPRGAFVQVELKGAVTEVARWPRWLDPIGSTTSLGTVRRVLDEAQGDPRVAGVVLKVGRLVLGGATARSLHDLLLEAKRRGQRVVVYLPLGGASRETYLAAAASSVFIGPGTDLAPLGFAIQAQYYKDALERIGVEPDVFARGRYKTAGEPFVSRAMSDAQREQLSRLLDQSYQELLKALSTGRNVPAEKAVYWIDEAPWPAKAAVAEGLADQVVHEDELGRALAPTRPKGAPVVSAHAYLRRRSRGWRPWRRPPYLAVIDLSGPIVSGSSAGLLPFASEPDFFAAVERVARDPKARGAVLYVNSPGGGAVPSERMLRRVEWLAGYKPVVAYFADVAASGGYLVAMGAHSLVAQPTSITGSIGVVAAHFGLGSLLGRLGIATETLKRGKRADLASPVRPLTLDDRQALERQIDEVYCTFLDSVARGRRRLPAEIEPLAGGRLYSGQDALAVGLVDKLGGFEVPLEELRTFVGLGAERLSPRFVGPWRLPVGALLPPRWFQTSLLAPFFARLPLWLDRSPERVWLWCEAREIDLGQGR